MVDPYPDRPNDHGMEPTLKFGVFDSVLKRENAVKTCPAHNNFLVFTGVC